MQDIAEIRFFAESYFWERHKFFNELNEAYRFNIDRFPDFRSHFVACYRTQNIHIMADFEYNMYLNYSQIKNETVNCTLYNTVVPSVNTNNGAANSLYQKNVQSTENIIKYVEPENNSSCNKANSTTLESAEKRMFKGTDDSTSSETLESAEKRMFKGTDDSTSSEAAAKVKNDAKIEKINPRISDLKPDFTHSRVKTYVEPNPSQLKKETNSNNRLVRGKMEKEPRNSQNRHIFPPKTSNIQQSPITNPPFKSNKMEKKATETPKKILKANSTPDTTLESAEKRMFKRTDDSTSSEAAAKVKNDAKIEKVEDTVPAAKPQITNESVNCTSDNTVVPSVNTRNGAVNSLSQENVQSTENITHDAEIENVEDTVPDAEPGNNSSCNTVENISEPPEQFDWAEVMEREAMEAYLEQQKLDMAENEEKTEGECGNQNSSVSDSVTENITNEDLKTENKRVVKKVKYHSFPVTNLINFKSWNRKPKNTNSETKNKILNRQRPIAFTQTDFPPLPHHSDAKVTTVLNNSRISGVKPDFTHSRVKTYVEPNPSQLKKETNSNNRLVRGKMENEPRNSQNRHIFPPKTSNIQQSPITNPPFKSNKMENKATETPKKILKANSTPDTTLESAEKRMFKGTDDSTSSEAAAKVKNDAKIEKVEDTVPAAKPQITNESVNCTSDNTVVPSVNTSNGDVNSLSQENVQSTENIIHDAEIENVEDTVPDAEPGNNSSCNTVENISEPPEQFDWAEVMEREAMEAYLEQQKLDMAENEEKTEGECGNQNSSVSDSVTENITNEVYHDTTVHPGKFCDSMEKNDIRDENIVESSSLSTGAEIVVVAKNDIENKTEKRIPFANITNLDKAVRINESPKYYSETMGSNDENEHATSSERIESSDARYINMENFAPTEMRTKQGFTLEARNEKKDIGEVYFHKKEQSNSMKYHGKNPVQKQSFGPIVSRGTSKPNHPKDNNLKMPKNAQKDQKDLAMSLEDEKSSDRKVQDLSPNIIKRALKMIELENRDQRNEECVEKEEQKPKVAVTKMKTKAQRKRESVKKGKEAAKKLKEQEKLKDQEEDDILDDAIFESFKEKIEFVRRNMDENSNLSSFISDVSNYVKKEHMTYEKLERMALEFLRVRISETEEGKNEESVYKAYSQLLKFKKLIPYHVEMLAYISFIRSVSELKHFYFLYEDIFISNFIS